MKAILFITLIIGVSFGSQPVSFGSQPATLGFLEVMDLVMGFFAKLNTDNDFPNIHNCINRIEEGVSKVKKLIDDLRKIDWSNIDTVFDALIQLFATFEYIFDSLNPCLNIVVDFKHFWDIIIKLDFVTISHRAMNRLFDLFCLITDSIMHIQQKGYYNAGKGIGEITYILLIKKDNDKMERNLN